MFCPKCGLQIDGSPKFCPKCGEPLVTSDAQQNAQGPAAGAGAPADGGTIAVVEKVLAACFGIFFVLRALTYVGALFRAGYYRYYYSSVFGIIIACLCLLLLIAGALLLAGTIASYGFLGREDQKKDLLVALMVNITKSILVLFYYLSFIINFGIIPTSRLIYYCIIFTVCQLVYITPANNI